MSNNELESRRSAAISRGVGVMTSVYADRAENAEIWDVEGNRYIDFASGIAVLNTGHRHPKVMQAVLSQIEHFTHTCHQVVPYENYVTLAERLNRLVPGDTPKKTIFVTTGAEALENAVKIARAATGRNAAAESRYRGARQGSPADWKKSASCMHDTTAPLRMSIILPASHRRPCERMSVTAC